MVFPFFESLQYSGKLRLAESSPHSADRTLLEDEQLKKNGKQTSSTQVGTRE
jgi:hypothetical protein